MGIQNRSREYKGIRRIQLAPGLFLFFLLLYSIPRFVGNHRGTHRWKRSCHFVGAAHLYFFLLRKELDEGGVHGEAGAGISVAGSRLSCHEARRLVILLLIDCLKFLHHGVDAKYGL